MSDWNLLHPEEARKETCPFIRFCVNEADVLQNGKPPIYVHQLCKADDCKIAWRGKDYPEKRGYCGIAGRP